MNNLPTKNNFLHKTKLLLLLLRAVAWKRWENICKDPSTAPVLINFHLTRGRWSLAGPTWARQWGRWHPSSGVLIPSQPLPSPEHACIYLSKPEAKQALWLWATFFLEPESLDGKWGKMELLKGLTKAMWVKLRAWLVGCSTKTDCYADYIP